MHAVRTVLYRGEGMEARLSWYGAGSDMSPHSHDYHQASILLAGRLLERHGGRDREVAQPSAGFKPAGLTHDNRYGRDGALILSVNLDPAGFAGDLDRTGWHWSPTPPCGRSAELLGLVREGGSTAADAVWDVLAAAGEAPAATALRGEPGWLRRIRERLEDPQDRTDIAGMAAGERVHRVHLSRCFQAHHAVPPSVYRSRHRVSRALGLLAAGMAPAAAATEAGYADQAHLSRAVKRQTGLTPGGFGRFLAAA